MTDYRDLIAAGYKPEQIWSCPLTVCHCKVGRPQKECGSTQAGAVTPAAPRAPEVQS